MTVITENLYAMENIVQKKFKKSEKKKAQPIYNPPEKIPEEKELEIKLLDLITKRRLNNHMIHEKWRKNYHIGILGI